MYTYNYQARNMSGEMLSGQTQAQDLHAAVASLKQKGLFLLRMEPQNQLLAYFSKNTPVGYRVSVKEKALFTHQFATLLKAGMQLTTALETLARQTRNKHLGAVITQIHSDIEQSSCLSEAMSRHPKVFSRIYTAVVEAAEQSGALPETLTILSSQLKSQASVKSRIKSALIYPIFLLAVSALVVTVLMTFVIPKFLELFVNANQALPMPTRILVCVTELFKNSWWMIFILLLGSISAVMIALKNKRFKLFFDTLLLKLPLFGTLNRKLQLARFARTFGSLLHGGVDILSAISTTKGTTNNSAFVENITSIEEKLLRGATVAKAMTQQKYFTEITANMVAVGEDAGMLPEMLLEVAEMYDQESESAISAVTTLLGPLMIVILGLIIGFVVLAILMPIFETSTMVA
jgi:type IV pilus assembly protein PilC